MESAECAGVDALLILYLSGSYQQATTVAQGVLDEYLPGIKEFAMLLDVLMEAENSAASKGAVNAYVQMLPGSKMHTFAGRYFVRWLYAHENLRKNVAGRYHRPALLLDECLWIGCRTHKGATSVVE